MAGKGFTEVSVRGLHAWAMWPGSHRTLGTPGKGRGRVEFMVNCSKENKCRACTGMQPWCLDATCYMLMLYYTCFMLYDTCCMLVATCYKLDATWCMLDTTCYMQVITWKCPNSEKDGLLYLEHQVTIVRDTIRVCCFLGMIWPFPPWTLYTSTHVTPAWNWAY